MTTHEPIAIVGFGGLFPGGRGVEEFWRNVAAGVDAGRDVPPGRWSLAPETACHRDGLVPDKAYSTWGCYLDEIPIAEEIRQRDPDWLRSLDPVCALALEAARQAAPASRLEHVDRRRLGVILGHIVLPTEATSALSRDVLLREFEERLFESVSGIGTQPASGRRPASSGCAPVPLDPVPLAPWSPRNRRVAALPAELIAEWFDFGGTAFTLDAACASSLYALKLAIDELHSGRADAMLAGGVSRPDCQYTQIGFSQLGALSRRGCSAPLSAAADGLVVGEGAGMFLLKRLSDAIAAEDRIEAVIAGIGLSNDRGANLLAPHSEGQLRAMRAAYREAGWSPEDVDYIECHATGTPRGDAVELDSLHQLWSDRPSRPRQCVLGAVKSNVGHLLTGAGAAGLMKILGMLRRRELWPVANFVQPAAALRNPDSPFDVVAQAKPWPESTDRPRRAAINAFGFGGINAHVLIEEWVEGGRKRSSHNPQSAIRNSHADDVVLVGMEASIGPWRDLEAVRDHVLATEPTEPLPAVSLSPRFEGEGPGAGTSVANDFPPPHRVEQIEIPVGEFRIPPLEIPDMLPQQQLMLQVTAQALDHAGVGRSLGNRAGVFLGVSLDPSTANFHCRWMIAERAESWARQLRLPTDGPEFDQWVADLQQAFGPPLTPNRVMGNLAAITASRIAREFDVGGPSFTISSNEDSGLHAMQTAIAALERGELDLAIVGAVEFGSDLRAQLADHLGGVPANDGAVAFVLKRRRDAERDGNSILAQVGLGDRLPLRGPATPSQHRLGHALATAGITNLLCNVLALTNGIETEGGNPRIILQDRQNGLRRIATSGDRTSAAIELEESPSSTQPVQAVGLSRRMFVIEGNSPAEICSLLDELENAADARDSIAERAHRWATRHPLEAANSQAIVLVVGEVDELRIAVEEARRAVNCGAAISSDRAHYQPTPLGRDGKLAFVFPGSGNAFLEMGRELLSVFPGVLRRQHAENEQLASQYRPDLLWDGSSTEAIGRDHKAMIFGQVSLGTALCDLLAAFGVRPAASIGYSLGESAALFGLRAWRDRDAMLERMRNSTLFGSDLVAPFDAARKAWSVPADQTVPWVSGIINAPVQQVRDTVSQQSRVYLQIINTDNQCVIGGDERHVSDVVRRLGATFVPFSSPSTVHCPILNEVRREYLALHRMTTTPPAGIEFYSSASGARYALNQERAATAILAQAVDTVDFPQVIRRAHRDGARLFLEVGPGNSCTRMIDDILSSAAHWAGAACPATSQPVDQFLSVLAQLIVHRVPVDVTPLFSRSEIRRLQDERRKIVTPVARAVMEIPMAREFGAGMRDCGSAGVKVEHAGQFVLNSASVREMERAREEDDALVQDFHPRTPALPHSRTASSDLVTALGGMLTQRAEAHAAFLRFAQRSQEVAGRLIERGDENGMRDVNAASPENPLSLTLSPETGARGQVLIDHSPAPAPPHRLISSEPPRSLDYGQCLAFAVGKIGDVLGPKFAEIDRFPTRVRLPAEPLMLCHRILEIEGEPLSMSHGRLVTEHDIIDSAWYLDCGRIPTCIAVEAGQADLFLSGWLGIDFETHGEAVYRLLDAVVTFHDALPQPEQTIRYEIRINRFFRQGETWLFRFEFDATVDGRPLLTMRDGCAGFFSEEELSSGKGIVQTALDRQPRSGQRADDWSDPVPMTVENYSDDQLAALRRGDLAGCFGVPFHGLPIANPVTLPDGRMRLVDRVLHLDPSGGKYGLGLIRAEADIHPDDWFLTCHFCDDQVMPGTLMYECCLHTLRIYLLRMGWIGEAGDIVYEPISEVRSRLKCRGQVLATTKNVWYEVTIKEIGYGESLGPDKNPLGSALSSQPLALGAYCLADALMYADGKPIVEMTDMSLRLTGLTWEKVEQLWSGVSEDGSAKRKQGPQTLFNTDRITEFAIGKPSQAFGDRYRVFDDERNIARLPGPPFQFLDRIVSIQNCEPWKLAAGGVIVAEYDVPPDAWYFAANRQPTMPFAVLLETALQPCGWLAAYLGSALTSDVDLSFRNLGGKATQFHAVTPHSGTLATTVKITSVSQSGGMIIQHFEFDLKCRGESVYRGTTYFGFFSKESLANQIGIRDAKIYQPTEQELARAESFEVSHEAPFPTDRFRMMDRVAVFIRDGGPKGLGFLRGTIDVDPAFWFFQAHFYQDPVWPGSLGLESLLQLLKVYAAKRWGAIPGPLSASEQFQAVALNHPHEWIYRGQVIPQDKTVTVDVVVTAVDDANRLATASGFLSVDGRVIYQMIDFTVQMTPS